MEFNGFSGQSFEYLMRLAVNNNRQFFEDNREVYDKFIRTPMLLLDEALEKTVHDIDPELITGRQALSRMMKDARYATTGGPYHDYSWLMYRRHGVMKSAFFGMYFSITPVSYSYGAGCYAPLPGFMQNFREQARLKPSQLLEAVKTAEAAGLTLSGDDFKRPPEGADKLAGFEDGALLKYYNKKYFYFEYQSSDTQNACTSGLAGDVMRAFSALAPVYRFIHGM